MPESQEKHMNQRMPVLFVGHGSPMNAVEDNEFSRAWIEAGKSLPRPTAVVCISAHWESEGSQVTAMDKPRTIYDFYGFPPEMYSMTYPAPGSPRLAKQVCDLLGSGCRPDQEWGLDHGAWSVLARLFPKADIPVIQLSLDVNKTPQQHYDTGRALRDLRDQGILILGSGNLVHNLRIMVWEDQAFDWALEFDGLVKGWIEAQDHDSLIHYEEHGRTAALAVNSAEHYKPLLYVLGAMDPGEKAVFFADRVTYGSISMRSFRAG